MNENASRKIIHVITTIDRGGAEKHLLSLAKKQKLRGADVLIISLKGKDELAQRFLEEKVSLLSTSNMNWRTFQVAVRALKSKDSIIHAHLPRAELVSFLLIKLLRRPNIFVITRHNLETYLPKATSRWQLFLSRLISKVITKRANALIAISGAVAEFLHKSDECNVDTPVHIVHYGIEQLTNHGCKTDVEFLKIGTIARFVEQKNLEFLLWAIKDLNSSKFRFSIIGRGHLHNHLNELIHELHIEDKVCLGSVVDDVDSFYETLDLFVMPSKYEGFGLVVLEALSHEIPVLASNILPFREILGENYPGLFSLESTSSLVQLLNECESPEFRNKLLENSVGVLGRFSLEKMVQETEEVYIECLTSIQQRGF